jgi:hypothetical protein
MRKQAQATFSTEQKHTVTRYQTTQFIVFKFVPANQTGKSISPQESTRKTHSAICPTFEPVRAQSIVGTNVNGYNSMWQLKTPSTILIGLHANSFGF